MMKIVIGSSDHVVRMRGPSDIEDVPPFVTVPEDCYAINVDDAVGVTAVPGRIYASSTQTFVSAPPPAPPAPTKDQLAAHALDKRNTLMNGGIIANAAASGDPALNLDVDTTGDGRANILGLQKLNDLGHDIVWIESSGPTTLTRAQLDALGVAAGLFVGNCYSTWGTVLAGITSGSITTTAAIDAAPWPSAS